MVAAIWLQTMTGLVAHGAIALVAMETAARGPTLQCIHAHLDACSCPRVWSCAIGGVYGQNIVTLFLSCFSHSARSLELCSRSR